MLTSPQNGRLAHLFEVFPAEIPELAGMALPAVRLHPRPGAPGRRDSSMGGPLLWPAGERWPHCTDAEPHESVPDSGPGVPMVPVLQLFRRDVPELPFPAGTDLFQLLWCPVELTNTLIVPELAVRWRDSASITDSAEAPAPHPGSHRDYLPAPSVLHPERVTDLPSYEDLPDATSERIAELEESLADRAAGLGIDFELLYQYHVSTVPGTKVGGWPSWWQGPFWDGETCPRGHRLAHLLSVTSDEWDGESWRTWLPEQEHPTDPDAYPSTEDNPTGIVPGDGWTLFLLTCLDCPDRPVLPFVDCG